MVLPGYRYFIMETKRADTTPDKTEGRKQRKKERQEEKPYPSSRTPSLITSTLVFLRNSRIASENDSLPSRSFMDTLTFRWNGRVAVVHLYGEA